MQGQVFPVTKLHYINGVVYFTARAGNTDLSTLAKHFDETTKSGSVKHPLDRVRTLARLAEGVGLISISKGTQVEITDLGNRYYEARSIEKWSLSEDQRELLCEHILANSSRTKTIHAICSLLALTQNGYSGTELAQQYAIAIEKNNAWKSDVTYARSTEFGLNYLEELGLFGAGITSPGRRRIAERPREPERIRNAFLFTWNPGKWSWDDLPRAVYEANAEGIHLNRWSCGATRYIFPGDRAFLVRLGIPPRGIMGSGVVVSVPSEDLHWDPDRAAQGDTAYRVDIVFDILSDVPILDEQILSEGAFSQHNWFPQASGTRIPGKVAEQLEELWFQSTGVLFIPPEPSDLPTLHLEGTKRSRLVTIYERNPDARERCLAYHGTSCQVCGLDFEDRYGSIGKGFIHVHHIIPVSEVGEEYRVNPVEDLCPVCPNCHAMLHRKTPPYTIDQLKSITRALNSKP